MSARVRCVCLCVEHNCSLKYPHGEVYNGERCTHGNSTMECHRCNKFSLCACSNALVLRSRPNIKCNKWHTLAVGTSRNEVFVSSKLWFFVQRMRQCGTRSSIKQIAYCWKLGLPLLWSSHFSLEVERSGRWRNALFVNNLRQWRRPL